MSNRTMTDSATAMQYVGILTKVPHAVRRVVSTTDERIRDPAEIAPYQRLDLDERPSALLLDILRDDDGALASQSSVLPAIAGDPSDDAGPIGQAVPHLHEGYGQLSVRLAAGDVKPLLEFWNSAALCSRVGQGRENSDQGESNTRKGLHDPHPVVHHYYVATHHPSLGHRWWIPYYTGGQPATGSVHRLSDFPHIDRSGRTSDGSPEREGDPGAAHERGSRAHRRGTLSGRVILGSDDRTTGRGCLGARAGGWLGGQFFIREPIGVQDPAERVTEDVWIVAIVEPPFDLFEVAIKMLVGDFVERTHDGPLQKAPDAFYAVGVYVSVDPFPVAVSDRFVTCVGVSDTEVGPEFIGVDRFGFIADVPVDEAMNRLAGGVLDPGQADVASPLDGPRNENLVLDVPGALALPLPAEPGLLHFDDPKKCGAFVRLIGHGLTDAVTEIPRRLVGHPEGAAQLIRRHTLLRFNHEVDGQEPLEEREMRSVHDGASRNRELVAA